MTDSLDAALETVSQQLGAAVRQQDQDRDPAHEDFYTWGWALTEVLDRVDQAVSVLERQVPRYGDRRILRDDAGADPDRRLVEATGNLINVRTGLSDARGWIREYHSAVSHIAVEVEPTITRVTDPTTDGDQL